MYTEGKIKKISATIDYNKNMDRTDVDDQTLKKFYTMQRYKKT